MFTEQNYYRKQYLWAPWTLKECAVHSCTERDFQIHHPNYKADHPFPMAYLVPMCSFHHRDLSVNVWPHVQQWLSLTEATLMYVVQGTGLHQHLVQMKVTDKPHPGVASRQLSLW
jgi:hypothetical protein